MSYYNPNLFGGNANATQIPSDGLFSPNPNYTPVPDAAANTAAVGDVLGASNASNMAKMNKLSMTTAIFGAASQAIGTYYSAKAQQDNLKFQADMAKINARMAESQAQHVMDSAHEAIAQVGYKAGKIKGAQKAAMAANGIQLGVGSAKEVVATTDIMKEIDTLTINANAVRAVGEARMQAVNYSNQAAMAQASASTINPFGMGATSLLGSAGNIAENYIQNKMRRDYYASQGGTR